MHLDLFLAVTLTRLAAAPFDIETESAWLVPSSLCLGETGEHTPDLHDVLAAFIIGLDARTKPYDMHLAIFGFEGWTDRSTIETPTLLLSGDGDFFVNQERLDYTCGLMPDCEVHPLIEGAGAIIGLEQPESYAAAIIEFLKRP